MGLLSKKFRKKLKKVAKRSKPISGRQRRIGRLFGGGFAGAIPMPISGRMGRINRLLAIRN